MSFDKFILAVESRDLSQADKGYPKTSQEVRWSSTKDPMGYSPGPRTWGTEEEDWTEPMT